MRRPRLAVAACLALSLGLYGCGQGVVPDPDQEAQHALSGLRGVPVMGFVAGSPDAPGTITAFWRLDDQRLARFLADDFVSLGRNQLRKGQYKLILRTLTTSEPGDDDSEALARTAQAAGLLKNEFYSAVTREAFDYAGAWDADAQGRLAREAGLSYSMLGTVASDPRVRGALRRANQIARTARASSGTFIVESAAGSTSRLDYEKAGALTALLRDSDGRR